MLANSASTYFLATPLGSDLSSVDIQYEDIAEETLKQFEAAFQKEQEDAKNRLLACFGKTRQGVFKKEEFKMPTFTPPLPNPSTTATATASSASTPSKVSLTFDSIKQFVDAFLSRFEQSQKFTQDMLIDLSMQNKGKKTINDYSTFFFLTLVFRPHQQRIISMVCRRITSRDRHPRRAQFGRPGPNRSDRSL